MDVVERTNRITLEVDLNNWQSVRCAIKLLQEESRIGLSDINSDFVTNKVRVIKILRSYGQAVHDGSVSAGLKSAKDCVEAKMDDIKLPLSRVLSNLSDY
jgi:ribosomal protein L7/L12